MSKDEIKLGKIKQIALVQKDVARAVLFYRDGLGLTLLFEVAEMAFFDAGGVRLMLTKASAPEFDHANSILYFDVPDIHAAYAQCKARGVTFEQEPHALGKTGTHEIWVCACRDPERNVIELMEERKL